MDRNQSEKTLTLSEIQEFLIMAAYDTSEHIKEDELEKIYRNFYKYKTIIFNDCLVNYTDFGAKSRIEHEITKATGLDSGKIRSTKIQKKEEMYELIITVFDPISLITLMNEWKQNVFGSMNKTIVGRVETSYYACIKNVDKEEIDNGSLKQLNNMGLKRCCPLR